MADLRVLVAPQEFKGTLTAVQAAEAIRRGLSAAHPSWRFDLLPMADGGPGTTAALLAALGGEQRGTPACDPWLRPIEATWGLLPGNRAVVECAAASGLLRMRAEELTPQGVRRATSYGTGQLIAAAKDAGVGELIVGLGGSATNDGGAGMAQALGFALLDAAGRPLPSGGAALRDLARIDAADAPRRLSAVRVLGATDVTNPLCGPQGASAVYGPQKGADAAAIADLDAALAHFAAVIKRDLGVDVAERPGAGAAGGLGAGLIAFLGAELISGARVVAEAAGLEARVQLADVVITGEGRLDAQTAYGKTPQYVAQVASQAGRPVVCVAGSVDGGFDASASLFGEVEALSDGSGALPSPAEAADQLAAAAVRVLDRLVDRGLVVQPVDM
ncbi:MAG TPA: glycerate kinase [Dehalococcoidia bacterium]|nr:glycerate kinase [Dehalococcoidia bacterium]